jgi:hypothetical protein
MMVAVRKIRVWRGEVAHRAGELARVLQPLAEAGADLKVVMGYAEGTRGIVEIAPISGRRQIAAARKAGLTASAKPTLLVEGDNRPGLGATLAAAIAARGVSISFVVAQVVGKRYSAVFGFHSDQDARAAAAAVRLC